MHSYQAFGLRIRSEIELPFLATSSDGAEVAIRLGPTPESLPSPLDQGVSFQVSENEFLLQVDGVARFWVRDGAEITIQPLQAPPNHADIALFLLGSVLGSILQQRCRSALHASAIVDGGEAVLFLGRSGSGKSTTLNALARAGFERFCDDTCPIEVASERVLAYPGVPITKMWPDSIKALGLASQPYERVRPATEKRFLPWPSAIRTEPLPVKAVFILGAASETGTEARRLGPAEAFPALRRHTFRHRFLRRPESLNSHFAALSLLAKGSRVSLIRRPASGFALDALVACIRSELVA